MQAQSDFDFQEELDPEVKYDQVQKFKNKKVGEPSPMSIVNFAVGKPNIEETIESTKSDSRQKKKRSRK